MAVFKDQFGQGSHDDAAAIREDRRKLLESADADQIKEFEAGGDCPWLLAWRVWPATFVTTDTGTGIVHIAPAFGEVDFELLQAIQLEQWTNTELYREPQLLCPVAPDGRFTARPPNTKAAGSKTATATSSAR